MPGVHDARCPPVIANGISHSHECPGSDTWFCGHLFAKRLCTPCLGPAEREDLQLRSALGTAFEARVP